MSRFLETIRFINGHFDKLPYHQKRMNQTRSQLLGTNKAIDLAAVLEKQLPENFTENLLYKCRVLYQSEITDISFVAYTLPTITTLQMVVDDTIVYDHKYAMRTCIDRLFAKRATADDVLIVKNGWITDTSYANILFFNGKQWLTPSRPLLRGTQRAFLLEKEWIHPADIKPIDLVHFSKIRLINAMVRFEDELDIKHILPINDHNSQSG